MKPFKHEPNIPQHRYTHPDWPRNDTQEGCKHSRAPRRIQKRSKDPESAPLISRPSCRNAQPGQHPYSAIVGVEVEDAIFNAAKSLLAIPTENERTKAVLISAANNLFREATMLMETWKAKNRDVDLEEKTMVLSNEEVEADYVEEEIFLSNEEIERLMTGQEEHGTPSRKKLSANVNALLAKQMEHDNFRDSTKVSIH